MRLGRFVSASVVLLCLCAAFGATTSAARGPKPPPPCYVAFPGAHSSRIGRTLIYNRQASVQYVVCDGFGLHPSADFPITSGMVCGLVSEVIGFKADRLGLFVSGACSGVDLAGDPREPSQYVGIACGWASKRSSRKGGQTGRDPRERGVYVGSVRRQLHRGGV
jgi:hypothetical protein